MEMIRLLLFFNVRIVSKSPTELYTPISAFIGLQSHTNLTYLVNLALKHQNSK